MERKLIDGGSSSTFSEDCVYGTLSLDYLSFQLSGGSVAYEQVCGLICSRRKPLTIGPLFQCNQRASFVAIRPPMQLFMARKHLHEN